MRILMLGWEFPPFISGGLGTACYGLTRALDRLGHRVQFVLPKSVDSSFASHVELISPEKQAGTGAAGSGTLSEEAAVELSPEVLAQRYRLKEFDHVEFFGIPSVRAHAYPGTPEAVDEKIAELRRKMTTEEWEKFKLGGASAAEALKAAGVSPHESMGGGSDGSDYGGDVIGMSQRYARLVVRLCARRQFDVVHAHDWMTYPAGMAMARLTGKPLVTHIHSTEFDRSGEHVNQAVYDIERRGMHAAARVIAVSALTKKICESRYSIDPDRIRVVYNGIDAGPQATAEQNIGAKDKIVLFLGRITMQKGPEYFVRAAKRVLERMENVKFVVAGSGDMAARMIEQAAEMGIGGKVLFTGFLRGRDVDRAFQLADCYVMPSVSEPFGIAPLEAMRNGTPVIISKQSGVSEVLTHALKVDFWDVDEMANKIIAVLRHPPLSQTLREHGSFEVRKLTWEGAAEKCVQVYRQAMDVVSGRARSPVMVG